MAKRRVQSSSGRRVGSVERRRSILDAAQSLFSEGGFKATTTASIASEVGVTEPILYRHFKGKREIFDSIMSELFQRVSAEVRSLPREATGDIPDQLKGNIERVTNLLLDNPLRTL